MNQILSIIMVIVMAFSSMAGMTAGIEGTVSFDAKISLDSEAVLAVAGNTGATITEETLQAAKVTGDILGALTLRGTASKDAAELALLAGDATALSVGIRKDETGATVASSLLGDDVIFVSAQMIEQMQQQMTQSAAAAGGTGAGMSALEQLKSLDFEQIAKDSAEAGEKLSQAIEARKGETETGEFTVDGMTFTAKTPVNMTYTEFAELFLTCVRDLFSKESMKPLVQMNGTDPAAQIDKAIEQLKRQPDEEKPVLDLAVYTDGDNCAYTVCNLVRESRTEGVPGEKICMAFGTVEGRSKAHVVVEQAEQQVEITADGAAKADASLNIRIEDQNVNAKISINRTEAGAVNVTAEYRTEKDNVLTVAAFEPAEGDRVNFITEVFFNGAEKPLFTLSGSAGKGGEMTSVFAGDGLNAVPIETLADPNNATAAAQLQMKMMAGLLKAVTIVTKAVPEDTATWINTQIRQMMAPQTPAVNE